MKIINTIAELRTVLHPHRQSNHSIGLVPTMGALHNGHLSLVEKAKSENDIVVVSIFVNPTQFNNAEDLTKYPRTLENDAQLLQSVDADFIFAPNTEEIYPDKHILSYNAGYLDSIMEGATRPGHFSGVVQVVAKLFNIIQPHNAYFGEKDLQQITLIRRLTSELCFPINIIGCPIVREESGLAMSSRNRRLSQPEQETATCLYKSLLLIKEEILNGLDFESALNNAKIYLSKFNNTKLEYIDICDATYLTPATDESSEIALCIACYVGKVRLIDNLVFTSARC